MLITRIFLFTAVLLSSLLFSCETESKDNSSTPVGAGDADSQSSSQQLLPYQRREDYRASKRIGGIDYKVSIVSALDFLKRKGEKLTQEEQESIKNEQVCFVDIIDIRTHKDIFEHDNIQHSKSKLIQYLMMNVEKDIIAFQGKKEFSPTASFYEGQYTKNGLRMYFYFKELNLNSPVELLFNDNILNQGLIRFTLGNEQTV
jgi:hypothetical protein